MSVFWPYSSWRSSKAFWNALVFSKTQSSINDFASPSQLSIKKFNFIESSVHFLVTLFSKFAMKRLKSRGFPVNGVILVIMRAFCEERTFIPCTADLSWSWCRSIMSSWGLESRDARSANLSAVSLAVRCIISAACLSFCEAAKAASAIRAAASALAAIPLMSPPSAWSGSVSFPAIVFSDWWCPLSVNESECCKVFPVATEPSVWGSWVA